MGLDLGGRTAVRIQDCGEANRSDRFVQLRGGLHLLRFQERENADELGEYPRGPRDMTVRAQERGDRAPGCCGVLFEDPDSILLEICRVFAPGVLAADQAFNPGDDFTSRSDR